MNSDWLRSVTWGCLAILLGAVVWSAAMERWRDFAVLGVYALLSVIFLLARNRLPALFSLLFVLAALINAAGFAFGLWDRIPGYDPLAHGYTTFAATLAAGFLTFYSVRSSFTRERFVSTVSLFSFGVMLGVLWEVFEWSVGVEQTYSGAIQDLVLNMAGAALACLLTIRLVRRKPEGKLPKN